MEQLIAAYPHSRYLDEVLFRRAEYFFTRKKYRDAEERLRGDHRDGPGSEYYELALYKLGWTLYKQEMYDEALHRYVALLDYKVSIGYDFDGEHEEGDERRIADTFRVISLSFSNLGGPEAVQAVLRRERQAQLRGPHLQQPRRVLPRRSCAITTPPSPTRRSSRCIRCTAARRTSACAWSRSTRRAASRSWCSTRRRSSPATYGLQREYWRHFDVQQSPEVLSYLKSNLKDLANHYHAQYQNAGCGGREARELRARRRAGIAQYLASFPHRPGVAGDQLSARRPAARTQGLRRGGPRIRAHGLRLSDARKGRRGGLCGDLRASREPEGRDRAEQADRAARRGRRARCASPTRSRSTSTPPPVLGAAADDLYDMKDFAPALATGRKLIERYPNAAAADPALRLDGRRPLLVRAGEYPQAEQAYTRVLELTPRSDESRAGLIDNLAASIYKQGEQANAQATIARPRITSCGSSRPRPPRRSALPPSTTPVPR